MEALRLAKDVDIYEEIILTLTAHFKPHSLLNYFLIMVLSLFSRHRYTFTSWKQFLYTMPEQVVYDLVFLVFHANEWFKKKALDILANIIGNDTAGIWMNGQSGVSSPKLSRTERYMRALSKTSNT